MTAAPADPRLDQYDAIARDGAAEQNAFKRTRIYAGVTCVGIALVSTLLPLWAWAVAMLLLVGAVAVSIWTAVALFRSQDRVEAARRAASAIRTRTPAPRPTGQVQAMRRRAALLNRVDAVMWMYSETIAGPTMALSIALSGDRGVTAVRWVVFAALLTVPVAAAVGVLSATWADKLTARADAAGRADVVRRDYLDDDAE